MKWIAYALIAVGLGYLVTAMIVAVFIMLLGGPFWVAVKSGLFTPFIWMGLLK